MASIHGARALPSLSAQKRWKKSANVADQWRRRVGATQLTTTGDTWMTTNQADEEPRGRRPGAAFRQRGPLLRTSLRRAALPLVGSLALGLTFAPIAGAARPRSDHGPHGNSASLHGSHRISPAFPGPQGKRQGLDGPILETPLTGPGAPSLQSCERIAPSVQSPAFLKEDPLSAAALQTNV